MFNTFYAKTGHVIWRLRGTKYKTQMIDVIFNFQYHKSIINSELFFVWICKAPFVLCESVPALNELSHVLLKLCL